MNTSINDLFYGNVSYDEKAAQAYQDVWLYDRDAEAKARVDANANAALYTMPGMKDTKGMALWGKEYARMVSPHLAENPMDLTEDMIGRLKDDGMKQRYTQEFQQLQASGKDYADDYYSMYARMSRDVQQKGWDDHQARVKAVEASMGKVYEYASGADMGQGAGAVLTQEDADNMRSVLAAGKMAELDDMRAFSRVYLRKLEQMDDGEAIIRGLDDLEDELLDIVGQDEEKAEMMYRVIMDWGQRVADSDKVSVGDEFLLSLGDKLRTWGQPRTQAMFATTPAVGAAGAINVGALSSAATQIQEAGKEGQEKALARGILRAGAQKAREAGENTGWVKGALRAVTAMAADTSPFLVPGLGIVLGPMDLAASSITDTYDMARASGETRFGAGVQAAIGAAVGPVVELLPFGKIGGVGLSRFTKYLTQVAPGAGSKVGALARAVGRWQHKNVWRALGAEAGAGFVGEALVEPIASGVASYGLEQTIYALGAPEGEQSRAFAKHFEELAAIWTDSTQLAGLALFTAALTGGSYRGIKANVKNRNVLFASGLTEEQVEQVMESDRPIETANSILAREMETDPEGLWERRAKQSQQLKEEGKVLFLTGAVAQAEVPELQQAYAAAWQELADKGILPSVTENEDGTFHVVQKGRYGEKDLDMTLTADAADAFVADAIRQFEDRELKLRQQELGKKAEMPNLRGALQEHVATIAGEAMARRTQEQGRFNVEDVAKQVPESIGRMIRANGSINRTIAERITDWAQGEIQALVAGGMDYKAAAASRDYAAGAVRSLGDWTSFAAGFTERAGQVGDVNALGTTLFRTQTRDEVLVDGARVLGSALFGVRGRMSGLNVLEDVTESVLDQMMQARAVHMVEQDSTMSRQEAEAKAWNELGEVVSRARAAVLKADPKAKVVEVKPGNKLSVIEAFSDISNSAFLSSGVVPKWMGPMVETMKANVTAANAAMTLAEAWNAAIEQDPNAVAAMRDILEKVGVEVGEVLADTIITAADVEAWKTARAVARADAYGPDGAGGDAVSEVVAEAEAEEAAILEAEKPASKEAVEEAKEEVRLQEEHAEQVFQPEPGAQVEEPEEVKGVFVGGYCVYNAAGGYYMGLVDKSQLRDGIEQVKVGAKGKHGVIAGRELVGNFQSSAAPLYVWKRKNGELWLISGRHRFELMLRDNGVTSHPCYVFVEDAEHDEKWARMMDYENNMRDDQADEVTAAMYVRETGYSDAELLKRGLLRNASRSKRGALIGRWAREELWTRFTNGDIKPMDAEIICNLTKNIKDQSRVEEIQRRCCMLLAEGKSWDFIGGMVQLMANKESITLKQGLLDLGADFEADLARAAAWIEKSLGKIKESISLLKQGRKLSGKKREEAERLGIVTATQEGAEEMLRDLEMLRGKYEMIGSYPDLVAQAQMWDGKTEVDPVGLYLERVQAEREQEEGRKELDADEYLRAKQAEAVPTLSFSMGQNQIITELKNNPELRDFMNCVKDVETTKDRNRLSGVAHKFGVLSDAVVNDVQDLLPDKIDLHGAIHTLTAEDVWHMYRGHCLDSFIYDDQISITYDDIRMIPDIVANYDSVKVNKKSGKWGLVFLKQYGDVIYKYIAHISRVHESSNKRHITLKTGWIEKTTGAEDDFTSIQSQVSSTSHFPRTAIVTPMEEFIKRNYKEEARKIAKNANKHNSTLHAPNGKITNLTPVQWLAVRLQSFKDWFGDWEHDPANASKVVDENGEPKVFYHHTNAEFTEFLHSKRGKTDAGWLGAGFYFYGIEDEGKGYGKNVMECFLNVREPYYASDDDMFRLSEADSIEESEAFTESLIEDGYDGVYYDGDLRQEMMVFEPNQIKSATDNRGTFDGGSPDITMSMGAERNLAAVHSIPLDTMLQVEKTLGGLAKPSIAITRLDKPYSWGGDARRVYLVGRPELADPQMGNLVYDRDAWTGKSPFLLEGGSAYDYRKGEYFEPTLEEFVARTIKRKGMEEGSDLRAQSAVPISTLEAVKAHREKLSDTEESTEQKIATNEALDALIEDVVNLNKKGLNYEEVSYLLARVCWRSSPMADGAPSEREVSREQAKRILNEMGIRVKDIKKPLVDKFVKAVAGLKNELEDYLESVPQRAVMFNEFEYAVMPESAKGTPGLDEMLARNGIRPIYHDGTEKGRRAALAGLVGNEDVSFSVVGEKAANWDEIKHLAFRGRDDGKLRVELDASGARLREDEFEGKAHRVFRYLLNAVNMKTLSAADNDALLAYAAAYKDFKQKEYKTIVEAQVGEDELREVRDASAKARALREAAYQVLFRFFKQYGVWLEIKKPENEYHNPNAGLDVLVADYAEGRVSEQGQKMLDEISGTIEPKALGDILDFPELYKAYPMLKKIEVNVRDLGRWTYGQVDRGWGRDVIVLNSQLLPDMEQLRSTLLHEVQHVIQGIEEFAAGGNEESARAKYTKLTNSYYRDLAMKEAVHTLRWLNGAEEAKVKLNEYRKALAAGAERSVLSRLHEEYNDLVTELNNGRDVYSRGYNNWPFDHDYWLPHLAGLDPMYLEILDKVWATEMKSRKRAFPGLEKKMKERLERLNNEAEADAKLALKLEGKSDFELYQRLAGEIEARNVQLRRDWTAEERRARPFNETLEYPGEALVTYSMTDVAQQSLHLLESRRDEVEAQVILEDMQKACERLSIVLASDDDPKVGNGLQVYAEMQALISATRRALPEKYLRQGNLNGLLAWAGVYARMAQTGQMPKRGAIKGEIYDRFVRELSRKNELMQLQGMSEAEAREVLMDLGSAKLETAFLKVGRDCSQRLDAFLKDRALERINWLYKMAYPKREEGQAWTRGKMASDAYRLVEKVMGIIGRSHEQRAKVDEELKEVRREQRKIRQAMEDGQMTEDIGKRKLKVLRGRMDRLEAEAMAAAADEHAKLLEELNRQVEELEDGEQKEEQESRLAEEIALEQTFGNWYYKGAGEAVRAARVFEDIVMRGNADWENKLKLERERRAFLKARIAANFNVADKDVENVRAGDRAAFKGKMGSKVKALGKGLMSMGHLLLALRPKMGRDFCDEQRAKLARINEGFMAFNMELDGWMYRTIRDITGIDTKERQKVWMNQMEEIKDTGIFITNRRTEKIVLTYAEAVAWLNMDKEARAKERERLLAEAAQEKRKPQNVPTEEVMDELGELVRLYEADKRGVEEGRKKFHLTHEVTWEEELRTTKGVLLFYLLTFEQPDYEHLMEVNGVSGATLDQMRRYIGPQMMKWGYAMREKLNEHGVLVADAFEAYTGIPFGSRELYFKGVFDRGPMKERDEKAAVEQGSAAAGTRTKYGSLIPRRYHKAKVERVSATQVFVQAMQQQNNYVQTAEYVREWRGLLSDKDFAKRLEAELGAATMQILNGLIGVLEGAAAGDAAAARAATGIINRMLGGYAVTRLAGNIRTLIKQGSAILNGFAGGYVPEVVVRNGELVQEMVYRKLGLGEFMMSMGRVFTFRGAVKKNLVTSQAYIAGRRDYEGKGLANTAMMEADQKVAGYVPEGGFLGWSKIPQQFWSWLGAKSAKATEVAMEAMGYVDSEMCALSAMALADAVYRQGKAEDKAGMVPDALLRAEALRIAGMALDIAAQPQVRTQKGYWAASGAFGAMGQFLYMFRSDTLQKVGLWGAQMTSGEKLPAAVGWISFGLLNAAIAELLVMLYGDLPDDDEELSEHALTFALNVLLGDVSALPVAGEAVGTVRNMIEGKHWAAQGGISEAVVPVVTLGSDIYREWKNIDKDAPAEKHWTTVARLLRSLGATAAFYHESTTGALANMSSVAAAAAVAGNASTLFKGILKAIEDLEE